MRRKKNPNAPNPQTRTPAERVFIAPMTTISPASANCVRRRPRRTRPSRARRVIRSSVAMRAWKRKKVRTRELIRRPVVIALGREPCHQHFLEFPHPHRSAGAGVCG